MCMIAGYNGTKRAAPVLIEMLKKMEGMNAGCFTGIATLHEGKIHYRKVVGNLDRLLETTDAIDLPGTLGVIHSRTPNGAPAESWAHPFTCEQEGVVRTALILNGMNGCCNDLNMEQYPKILQKIKEAGYPLKSGVEFPEKPEKLGKHPWDGKKLYQKTDCLAQLVSMKILEEGMEPIDALEKSMIELSGENVILLLSDQHPDIISWARVNFPLYLGLADHGVCVASAPIALAEHTDHPTFLPALSGGTITKEGMTIRKLKGLPLTVAPVTPAIWHDAYEAVIAEIKKENYHFSKVVAALFEEEGAPQNNAVTWAVLSELYRQGKIDIKKVLRPGVREDVNRTSFEYPWKE